MKKIRSHFLFRLIGGVGLAIAAASVSANAPAQCRAIGDLGLPATTITQAEFIAAGQLTLDVPNREALPAFCRVAATTEPAIRFEVWMPATQWNSRFAGLGNGGMAGTIRYDGLAGALSQGYAVASTDTGHRSSGRPFDASWATGRDDLIHDFGHRSLHEMTLHAKAIVAAFYGEPAAYAYYRGCSKGGQQGMMQAQRYPGDYDGLLVGNPANDWTRFYAGAHLWYSMAMLAEEGSWLPPEKIPTLGAAIDAQCDALDGVRDGVINDPRECDFDVATLSCPDGEDRPDCLTASQVEAVGKIYAGVERASGELIFPGLVPGGEADPGGWSRWVTGQRPFSSLHWFAGNGFFRDFVFGADFEFRDFDFDRDLDVALAKVGPALDAVDPDLGPLDERGAKLLVYHGWSDADISPLASIDYYESVVDLAERRGVVDPLAETRDFYRLFMVPGLGHCAGGPGATDFDAMSALERWVEEGVAPEVIAARRVVDGEVVFERPLCAYPAVARYDGVGDPDAAASFRCEHD